MPKQNSYDWLGDAIDAVYPHRVEIDQNNWDWGTHLTLLCLGHWRPVEKGVLAFELVEDAEICRKRFGRDKVNGQSASTP